MKSNMKGLKAMFKKLSPSQKKEMMSAKYGMEKPLMKMGGEGMLDMSKQMEANMRYGGRVPMTQKQMGGEDMGPIPGRVPERLRPGNLEEMEFSAPSRRQKRGMKRMMNKIKRKARKNARQKARQQRKTGKGDSPFNSNNLSRMKKGGSTSKRYGGGTASTYSGKSRKKK